jgi:hypothetical protein
VSAATEPAPAAIYVGAAASSDVGAYEAWLHALAFCRSELRVRGLKCQLDCGHWIDGSELYHYPVWRANHDPRGTIHQRTECEPCARGDLHG